MTLDPAWFDPANVPAETARFNADLVARLSKGPDVWSRPLADVRQARAAGLGTFPLPPPDAAAECATIEGKHGPIQLRLMHPKTARPRGTYLHFHGGGWVMGSARENDDRLRRLCEAARLSIVSVDYRLAPESPYPQGPDDCETAALWLIGDGGADLERSFLAIGGESAGAHLAAVTLLRLRERHHASPFAAALMTAGCYDLSLTPSVRNWGDEKLVINTRDVEQFVAHFLARGGDAASPDISPLHANLEGMPPALFSCGTADLLIDDTLFMAARWLAAGNRTGLSIHPGGCHVFQAFDTQQARLSLREMEDFLSAAADTSSA
ncbi:alpha/beta hydrolase [Pararhizobium haloflavum]|uniref:alpha/beta hydrolase n=1 Tax=Pararhizobium haloflavum TaxID=2037914 RepID=UPI000C1A8A7A